MWAWLLIRFDCCSITIPSQVAHRSCRLQQTTKTWHRACNQPELLQPLHTGRHAAQHQRWGKKKKKSNPVFWCKSQVSFVSSDYNGRGVKVWWATVEIAVTTRGSGEGYIILKCPKRDEARELESLQWHAGFAVVLFPHSLSPCAHAAPRVTPWLHSLLHPRRKKKKNRLNRSFCATRCSSETKRGKVWWRRMYKSLIKIS